MKLDLFISSFLVPFGFSQDTRANPCSNPNPCQNGATCTKINNVDYTCECTGTLFFTWTGVNCDQCPPSADLCAHCDITGSSGCSVDPTTCRAICVCNENYEGSRCDRTTIPCVTNNGGCLNGASCTNTLTTNRKRRSIENVSMGKQEAKSVLDRSVFNRNIRFHTGDHDDHARSVANGQVMRDEQFLEQGFYNMVNSLPAEAVYIVEQGAYINGCTGDVYLGGKQDEVHGGFHRYYWEENSSGNQKFCNRLNFGFGSPDGLPAKPLVNPGGNDLKCYCKRYLEATCQCAEGFVHENCQTPIPCFSNPCNNGGNCTNISNFFDYECECPLGWIGDNCDKYLPCELATCLNGATCTNNVNPENPNVFLLQCNCLPGFAGELCEIEPQCNSGPCQNSGACVDSEDFSSYSCECLQFFNGTNCETATPCLSAPCQNAGVCLDSADLSSHTCACPPAFTGLTCETPIPCFSDPCQNNGICENSANFTSYSCSCPSGIMGNDCEIIIPCDLDPCQNGANCTNSVDFSDYNCACLATYTGINCELPIPCESAPDNGGNPCFNDGICTNNPDYLGETCECSAGFFGTHCNNVVPCSSSPCLNSGICQNGANNTDYTCTCAEGFTNENCQTSIGCYSSPCLNGGNCTNSVDFSTYTCECDINFTNTDCQDDVDACESSPCLNGGTCTDLVGIAYACTCEPQFTDSNCQTIVPCEVNGLAPCNDFGVCLNDYQNQNFTCNCDGYHEGDFCGTEIIFPPGEDTNPTVLEDPFPCTWDDPFCIVYIQTAVVFDTYEIPELNFVSRDDRCDEDDPCDDRCEDFNPEWCSETATSRKRRQADPPQNNALAILENYGCWCSKMFTGFALMGEVLDDTDSMCREFSRCWRCIGMMECEGDLAEPYVLDFTPSSDNYTCTSNSTCAEQRCLCVAEASVKMARHLIEINSTLIAENYNVDPSLCVRGDGSVFNDQCCGTVPLWIPYNGLLETCVDGIVYEN